MQRKEMKHKTSGCKIEKQPTGILIQTVKALVAWPDLIWYFLSFVSLTVQHISVQLSSKPHCSLIFRLFMKRPH